MGVRSSDGPLRRKHRDFRCNLRSEGRGRAPARRDSTLTRDHREHTVNPRPLRSVDIFSSAGRLEALYRDLQDPSAVAVVCHPHPLGGGTLHNKVVFRVARGLENANVATLRFNFRGAGTSAGVHDEGEGEIDDVTAAIDWAKKKHPGRKLIVGGFSFGAWVASRVACELPEVKGIFLIGTPLNKYDFGYLRTC